jgi:hypothetical protein
MKKMRKKEDLKLKLIKLQLELSALIKKLNEIAEKEKED